jgi:hypothetical protein
MSRTDRHRPYWVQIKDPWEKNKSYNHWSGSGEPQLLHNICGCNLCHRDAFQEPQRRTDRHRGKAALRRWIRGADSWD